MHDLQFFCLSVEDISNVYPLVWAFSTFIHQLLLANYFNRLIYLTISNVLYFFFLCISLLASCFNAALLASFHKVVLAESEDLVSFKSSFFFKSVLNLWRRTAVEIILGGNNESKMSDVPEQRMSGWVFFCKPDWTWITKLQLTVLQWSDASC